MTVRSLATAILTSCLLALSSAFAHAQDTAKGGTDSGGGHIHCAKYADLVGMIATAVLAIPEADLRASAPNTEKSPFRVRTPITDKAPLRAIKESLKCLPVDTLDRQARSTPSTYTTLLLVKEWKSLSAAEQLRLATHELAVLARYEGDGEYFVSEALLALLKKRFPEFERFAGSATSSSAAAVSAELRARDLIYLEPGSELVLSADMKIEPDAEYLQFPQFGVKWGKGFQTGEEPELLPYCEMQFTKVNQVRTLPAGSVIVIESIKRSSIEYGTLTDPVLYGRPAYATDYDFTFRNSSARLNCTIITGRETGVISIGDFMTIIQRKNLFEVRPHESSPQIIAPESM